MRLTIDFPAGDHPEWEAADLIRAYVLPALAIDERDGLVRENGRRLVEWRLTT